MRRFLLSPALAPAIAACLLVLLCIPMLPGSLPRTTRAWNGYYTLLVRDGAFDSEVLRLALARVAPDAVSDETAVVSYSDIEGPVTSTYARLSTRLDADDPRFDSYLLSLGDYFRAAGKRGRWRIAYLPARRTSAAVFRGLSRELGSPLRGAWRLLEFDPLEKSLVLASALAFAAVASLSVRKTPRRRDGGLPALSLVHMLCWVPLLASGGMPELCLVVAVFPGWVRLARERRVVRSRARREENRDGTAEEFAVFTAVLAVALAALLLIAGFSWFRLVGALMGAACGLLLLAIRAPLAKLRRAWSRRSAFPSAHTGRPVLGPLHLSPSSLLPLAAAPLILALITVLRAPLIPVPSRVAALGDFSWRSLTELAARRPPSTRRSRLPDIADYVSHVAYQQTLIYGRPYSLPKSGERWTVVDYLENPVTGEIVPRRRTVKAFDEAWLAGLTHAPRPASVEGLLLAQGRPVTVAVGRARAPLIRDLLSVVLCGLALLGWFADDAGLRHLIRERVWRFTTPKHTR